MKVIFDIETVDKDWYLNMSSRMEAARKRARAAREQWLRKTYPDLDLLWLKYADLDYELRTLNETSKRYIDTPDELIILQEVAEIERATLKAKEEYDLVLKLLWDDRGGVHFDF